MLTCKTARILVKLESGRVLAAYKAMEGRGRLKAVAWKHCCILGRCNEDMSVSKRPGGNGATVSKKAKPGVAWNMAYMLL